MMPRVRGEIASSIRSTSMLKSRPTSTRTGRAPTFTTAEAVATNVWAGTITSSPGPIPQARSDMCSES